MRFTVKEVAISTVLLFYAMPGLAQELYIYPAGGQSTEQMDKDKHECYKWARNDTGFDPMEVPTTSTAPPSSQKKSGGVVKGGLAGAATGAIIGDSRKATRRGAAAGDFDGSKTLVCANQTVNECLPSQRCRMVAPQSVNLPNFFNVDTGNKVLTGKHDGGIDASTPVERFEHLDEKLILQGADDGIEGVKDGNGWTMVIDESSGKMSMTVSGDGYILAVFGACITR